MIRRIPAIIVALTSFGFAGAASAQIVIGFSAPSNVQAGSTFDETVVIAYTGTKSGRDYLEVNFSATSANGLHIVQNVGSQPDDSCTPDANNNDKVKCYGLQAFHPGSTFTFHVRLHVDAGADGEFTGATLYVNACSFQMTGGPFVYAQHDYSYKPPQPDVSVSMVLLPKERPEKGDYLLLYLLSADNVGPDPTSGVITVSDPIPAGTRLVAGGDFEQNPDGDLFSKRCSVQFDPARVECSTDRSIPPSEFESFHIVLTTDLPDGSSITNRATVSGGGDVNPSNNETQVTFTTGDAILTATKNHGAAPDGTRQISIVVKNVGGRPTRTPVTVKDFLPAGMTVDGARASRSGCSIDGSVVTCRTSGPLSPFSTSSINIVLAITTLPDGDLSNTVEATADGAISAYAADVISARSGSFVPSPDPKTTNGRR